MKRINLIAFFLLIVAFDIFFWGESLALNFAIFSVLTIVIQFLNSPESYQKKTMLVTTFGNLVSIFMLVYFNSTISVVASIISWIVMIGFYHEDELRTVYRAIWSSGLHFFKIPPFLRKSKNGEHQFQSAKYIRFIKIMLLPFFFVFIFFLIFRGANQVFSDVTDQLGHDIEWAISQIIEISSVERMAFILLGVFVANWVVYQSNWKFYSKNERAKSDQLWRVKGKNKFDFITDYLKEFFPIKTKMLKLKNENKSAVLMMGMICSLLLIINAIDIVYVWFGYDYNPTKNFSKDVHKGVNLLIFSIILSIVIMLYYFRGNQNFYAKNTRLKKLSYTWIALNGILIISVFIRNIHYINHLGLTHKRIGIFVFLTIVLLGLISLYWKISQRKSFFYMSKFNSWSVYFMLIFIACFNWDMIIFNHNFAKKNELKFDRFYVLDYLSDEAILHLKLRERELNNMNDLNVIQDHQLYRYNTLDGQLERINRKMEYGKNTWQTWSYRKLKVKKLLQEINY
jgi:hypothetical protein